jgi:hypothetical protein
VERVVLSSVRKRDWAVRLEGIKVDFFAATAHASFAPGAGRERGPLDRWKSYPVDTTLDW